MPIKNYTTSIAEEKTVGEIMSLLAQKGARSIKIDYDDRNRPSAVSFVIFIKQATGDEFGIPVPYKLPCNFDGVFNAMMREFKDRHARFRFERNPESKNQARRVAWRIVKDWIAAQLALVEAGCAQLAEVFLPYATYTNRAGGTMSMYDRFLEQVLQQKSLTSGESNESNQQA